MKIKLYEEGEKSKAVCDHCGQLVSTTFARRDVPFSDGKCEVKNILAAVCDVCGEVAAVPAQSTPAIREARRKEVKPIEAQLPAMMRGARPPSTASHCARRCCRRDDRVSAPAR